MKVGNTFRFKKGRKVYTLTEIRHETLYVYHDITGVEYSADVALFPTYFKNVIILN